MESQEVIGGRGIRIRVVEAGNPAGPAILFVHGWSQGAYSWRRQLTSPVLQKRFRLLALDLRGHGDSEKPPDGYDDSQLWADDVHGVISGLALKEPMLCAWSYGGYVVNDLLRHYGSDGVKGINYVGSAADMGIETDYKFLGSGWDGVLPDNEGSLSGTAFADDAQGAALAMRRFLRACFSSPLSPEDELSLLGMNLLCPPRVRLALFSRVIEARPVLSSLDLPVLISHGEQDKIIDPETAGHIAALVPQSRTSMYAGAGHAPFWEEPERFNNELAAFADSL